jgi:hypothetical protein
MPQDEFNARLAELARAWALLSAEKQAVLGDLIASLVALVSPVSSDETTGSGLTIHDRGAAKRSIQRDVDEAEG